ncbi:hypothetical protein EV127DRAFT_377975 [Xylaria flabelliformis]|nr:hypothetical protein EV127DRAFT_377975 [Xylaria flabelliformis]
MSNPRPLKGPCRLFQKGNCRFGARCKFSHDLARGSQAGNRHTAPSTSKTSQRPNPTGRDEDDLREWKRLLRQGRQSPNRTICDRFFELAVKLVDGDPGGLQETIKLLADEDGLTYIRLIVERHIPSAARDHEKRDIWTKQIQPLFTVVTDQRVADSALLEQPVAAIYNFMQGVGSRRMKVIFDFSINLTQLNPNTNPPATTIPIVSNQVIIEKCLAVLSKMVDCSTNNIVDETFKTVAQRIQLISKQVEKTSDDYLILQSQKWISYINRRIGVGDELPFSEVRTAQSTESRAEFTLPKNLPGNLSASGRRHTNDHADITNISILPTQDEIVSARGEYLPSNDPTSFHHPGIIGRLDREFRLLREDTIGQLRDVVRDLFEEIQGRKKIQRHERQSLRTYTYKNAEFVHISFERLNGLDLLIRFPQPMSNITGQKRRDWWSVSKRLQPGALVCVISEDGSVLFCVVAEAIVITADEKTKRNRRTDTAKETPEQENLSLAEDNAFAYVHLNIAEFKDNNFRQALRWYQNVGPKFQLCLVEFPGVLLASFQHTLTALQRMSKTSDVPFVDLIAPPTQRAGIVDIPPPQYTTKPGFYFDLSCLTKDGSQLRFSPTQHLDPQILTKQSTLDETQSIALVDSLSRGLALIQGPPGTGKSYTGEKIIRVLLANKAKGKLGPILCVCYTNHALDQLLEHLLDDGIKQIIRIGSRSKSERLEEVNLRIIARAADRTKSEGSSLWDTKKALIAHESTASNSLEELEHCLGRSTLQAYLAEHHPQHHQALFGTVIDEEGFQEVRHRPNQLFDQWLNGGTNSKNLTSRPVEQLLTAGLWTMNRGERHRLYYHWQRKIRDPIIQNLLLDYQDYTKTREQRNCINQEIDLRCLSTANVVGVTTTGLARNLDLLRRLRCKVLICEEAGEVLEAHNLTALLPSIEHCVLIGDQLQLRPQIQNYDLNSTNPRGAQYSLDVSLFERLISPSSDREQKLPFNTLETQRRMHPCISELIRRTLYPKLVDGGAVTEYPEVQGLRKRLFWLEHTVLEDRAQHQDPTSTSHTNSFEVDMTVAFVQHLVRQGTYGPDDIAVITPYLGQLYRLRRVMQSLFQISVGERDLEELEVLEAENAQQESAARVSNAVVRTTLLKSIRLATVDNFQGEEAKVVVISLVRSNSEQRCGFLSTPNRINVLLSRAKHGMYLIGNADTYKRVPMWEQVITMLRDEGNIGPVLQLRCPRHPEHPIEVSTPDHFLQFSPEGGCLRQCDRRLSCGHACVNRCHSQVLHQAVKCLEPCPRMKKGCSHPCRRSCGDACEPKCTEKLEKLNMVLSCGHKKATALCWQVQDPSSIVCRETTSKTVPGCGHTIMVPCYVDVTVESYRCTSPCGDPQPCGHTCRSECHLCKDRTDGVVTGEHHEVCRQPCDRNYTACNHTCRKACHGQEKCPPCSNPCEARCSHSKCSKQCHEPCAPCAEQRCSSACPHQKCTMPCAAPCNWIPCSKRCEQFLECGHGCPSLCGEACPDTKYCQVCCTEDIKSTTVDWIMGMQYHEINLDEDPCIFPDCGHFLTKSNMDGVMDLKAHYEMSTEDSPSPVSLSSSSMPFSMDEVKKCPSCRGSLRNIARYGRIIRRATLDEATKKFMAWSHSEYLKLAGQLVNVQIGLEEAKAPEARLNTARQSKLLLTKGRFQQLCFIRDWVGNSRYSDALRLWAQVSTFISQVRKEEQPLQRVADFVRHASRQQQQVNNDFVLDESVLQAKGLLQASALSLKCEVVIFTDFMTIRQPLLTLRPEIKLDLTKQIKDCESLIEMAKSAHYPREQVEGHIYFAKFCSFARALTPEPSEDSKPDDAASQSLAKLKEEATAHVAAARELLTQYPSTIILKAEVDAAEKMLRDAVFYTEVSAAEMRAVYKAMAGEFLGTGHWYTCANGHPFTVGECGMPMEQARCPECGAPVGGADHQAAEGVRHAREIEALARDVNRLGI